jgi:hypothetical protein
MGVIPGSLVAHDAYKAGWRGWRLITIVAISRAESGWNTTARNHTSREDSRGLTQINVYAHPWGASINLYNGEVNMRAALRVYNEAGGSFTPWSVYLHCTYARYVADAIKAVRDNGQGRSLAAEIAAAAHAQSKGCGVDTTIVEVAVGQLSEALGHAIVVGFAPDAQVDYADRGVRRGRRLVRHYSRLTLQTLRRHM